MKYSTKFWAFPLRFQHCTRFLGLGFTFPENRRKRPQSGSRLSPSVDDDEQGVDSTLWRVMDDKRKDEDAVGSLLARVSEQKDRLKSEKRQVPAESRKPFTTQRRDGFAGLWPTHSARRPVSLCDDGLGFFVSFYCHL